MNTNQKVAKAELRFLGGTPKVGRYTNENGEKTIDIFQSINVPQDGVQSCATIGLNSIDLGLVSNSHNLRVEIVGASDIAIENLGNIMASIAFEIMQSRKCFPGYIITNVIQSYIPNSEMQHVLLTDPFLWEEAKCIVDNDLVIVWLMMVPISDKEYQYAKENGVEELEKIFEAENIDIYNFHRESVI